jgi:hypothetical protein
MRAKDRAFVLSLAVLLVPGFGLTVFQQVTLSAFDF